MSHRAEKWHSLWAPWDNRYRERRSTRHISNTVFRFTFQPAEDALQLSVHQNIWYIFETFETKKHFISTCGYVTSISNSYLVTCRKFWPWFSSLVSMPSGATAYLCRCDWIQLGSRGLCSPGLRRGVSLLCWGSLTFRRRALFGLILGVCFRMFC